MRPDFDANRARVRPQFPLTWTGQSRLCRVNAPTLTRQSRLCRVKVAEFDASSPRLSPVKDSCSRVVRPDFDPALSGECPEFDASSTRLSRVKAGTSPPVHPDFDASKSTLPGQSRRVRPELNPTKWGQSRQFNRTLTRLCREFNRTLSRQSRL